MAKGSFFTLQTSVIRIDEENSVTIRKLTHGEKMKIIEKVGGGSEDNLIRGMATLTTAMEMAIVGWSGPGFGDAPVSPEEIGSLPSDVVDMIIEGINQFGTLNAAQKKASSEPTN